MGKVIKKVQFPDGSIKRVSVNEDVTRDQLESLLAPALKENRIQMELEKAEDFFARQNLEQNEVEDQRDNTLMQTLGQGAVTGALKQGSTLFLSDEIEGAVGATVAKLFGGKATEDSSWGDLYEEGRDQVRGVNEKFRSDHPFAALGLELVGGVVTGGPLTRLNASLKAKNVSTIARRTTVGALPGAVFGFGASEGETPQDLLMDASLGAVFGAGFNNVLGQVSDKIAPRIKARFEDIVEGKSLDDFQLLFDKGKGQGLNDMASFRQAKNILGVETSDIMNRFKGAGREFQKSRPASTKVRLPDAGDGLGTKEFVKRAEKTLPTGTIANWQQRVIERNLPFDQYIRPIATRIMNRSAVAGMDVRRMEMLAHSELHEAGTKALTFSEGYSKHIPKGVRRLVDDALMNGDKAQLSRIAGLYPKSNLLEGVAKLEQDVFPGIWKGLQETGTTRNGLKFVDGFFPRWVKDVKGLKKALVEKTQNGTGAKLLDDATKAFKKNSGRDPNADEFARIVQGIWKHPSLRRITRTEHGRKFHEVPVEFQKFYGDSLESLNMYMRENINEINKRRFLGSREGGNLQDDVNNYLTRLKNQGEVNLDGAVEIGQLLGLRFNEGEQSASKAYQNIKNLIYADTLANPVAAATQIGDVGVSAYVNGLWPTIKGMTKVATTREKNLDLSMQQMGLRRAGQELNSNVGTVKILDAGLNWSGFNRVDQFGKNVNIQASKFKWKSKMGKAGGRAEFAGEYDKAFSPDEMIQTMQELQQGLITPRTKMVHWNTLSNSQPISLSEMPEKYLQHPDGRMFYMLKTFALKQLDLARRTVLETPGSPAQRAARFTQYVAYLGLSGASADMAKDFMLRRPTDFTDSLPDGLMNQMMKTWGMSEYIFDKIKKNELKDAAIGLVGTPLTAPLDTIEDVVDDLKNMGTQFETLKNIPPWGRILHQYFAGGMEADALRREEEIKSDKRKERRERIPKDIRDRKKQAAIRAKKRKEQRAFERQHRINP